MLSRWMALRRPIRHGAHEPLRDVKVAAVVDEFTRDCLEPEVDLIPLHARGWRLQLEATRPDLLLVESAWRGQADSWKGRIARYPGRHDQTLKALVRRCRALGIPTVFWNKEDPVHFERFVDKALLFDCVLTTDERKLDAYRAARRSAAQVFDVLPFAAQPALHHPSGASTRPNAVCFAGSYAEPELPQRREDVDMLLRAASDLGLVIYDRNSDAPESPKAFPPRYRTQLRPRVSYRDLCALQRTFKVCLNTNSIRDSPTMFSRRVFELLAAGTPVVSSPSRGVRELFGDIVDVVSSEAEAREALQELLSDRALWRERSAAGVRRVMLGHTYADRLAKVLALAGVRAPAARPDVGALAHVEGPREARGLVTMLRAQDLAPSRVVVGVRNAAGPDAARTVEILAHLGSTARVVDTHGVGSRFQATRLVAGSLDTPWVACLAPHHRYGPGYLTSLACCVPFVDDAVIGKAPDGETSHEFVESAHPHALLVSTRVLRRHSWSGHASDRPELRARMGDVRHYATDAGDFNPAGGRPF